MKKVLIIVLSLLFVINFNSCSKNKSLLDPDNPVTMRMWHVYGEQADSPMSKYIETFNKTIGKEKGIIIDVTLMSNATQIGRKLLDAQSNKPGAPDMPDLFFCHTNNAIQLGKENLVNFKDLFDSTYLSNYVTDFINDGYIGDSLSVFPVSKSTHMMYIAGGAFDRFAQSANVSYDDLETWEGFFDICEKYYEYSGGKPFCTLDYLMRAIELYAISKGTTQSNLYTQAGWYNFGDELFVEAINLFSKAIANGYITLADLYSNTQMMTGEVICGIGSSASILYYNDVITYNDNTTEPMNLKVLPLPYAKGGKKFTPCGGVGLCAYKTTKQKEEATKEFVEYFTSENVNFDFVVSTGYMPVVNNSFDKIKNHTFKKDSYKNLYNSLMYLRNNYTFINDVTYANYYEHVNAYYAQAKEIQKTVTKDLTETQRNEIAEKLFTLLKNTN